MVHLALHVTFSVDKGEVFGYLGPNGAGKTTTMRVLLGLLRPTAGTALVRGTDLSRDDAARGSVGVLMENDGLYDRISAWQNLDYYGKLYHGEQEVRQLRGGGQRGDQVLPRVREAHSVRS